MEDMQRKWLHRISPVSSHKYLREWKNIAFMFSLQIHEPRLMGIFYLAICKPFDINLKWKMTIVLDFFSILRELVCSDTIIVVYSAYIKRLKYFQKNKQSPEHAQFFWNVNNIHL